MNTFEYKTNSKTILADLYTPVGVYMRLRDLYPQSALMECADYHDAASSRSFIGISPLASVAIGHGFATICFPDGTKEEHEVNKQYRSDKAIHALIDRIQVEGDDASVCGLFGYTSFNAVRYFEDIAVKDETQEKNDAPDMLYILYKVVIVFDHHNNTLKVVTLGDNSDIDNVMKAMNPLLRNNGYEQIYSNDPSTADAYAWVQFITGGADGLGRKELNFTYTEYRQYGNGKEYYTQASYPLGQAPPEQQTVRHGFYVINDGCARGRETGHGLKEGIGIGRYVSAQVIGQGPENGEQYPTDCNDDISVAAGHGTLIVKGAPAYYHACHAAAG